MWGTLARSCGGGSASRLAVGVSSATEQPVTLASRLAHTVCFHQAQTLLHSNLEEIQRALYPDVRRVQCDPLLPGCSALSAVRYDRLECVPRFPFLG